MSPCRFEWLTSVARARVSHDRRAWSVAIALALTVLSGGRPTGQIVPTAAVDFDGTNDYITFGTATGASGLNATDFTLEMWFRREGAGLTTTSGTGGLATVVPLVAKGRGEAEGSNVDMNYLLGLNVSGGVYTLAADFEQLGGTQPGLNHPVTSATAIAIDTWYHAAATYSSGTGIFTLYLNGAPVGSITIANALDRFPRSDSIQHASIGSALNSTGVTAGFFNGVIDEVRIWNVARMQAEIAGNM